MVKSRLLEAIRAGSVDPWFEAVCHKDSPSPPPAPDYAGAAQAQGAANKETALTQGVLSNPNINTPYGNQTVTFGTQAPAWGDYLESRGIPRDADTSVADWTQWGGRQSVLDQYSNLKNQPTVTQTLAPAQQGLLDSQNRLSSNLAGVAEAGVNRVGQGMAAPFDTSNLAPQTSGVQGPNYTTGVNGGQLQSGLDFSGAPQLPGVNDFGKERDQVTNSLLARSEPQFARDEELTRTRLMNQGLAPGSEASNYDLDTLNRARNDARTQATLAGSQEQSRLFGLASQARGQYTGEQAQQGNFTNAAQAQGFTQGQQNAGLNNQVGQQMFTQGLANANLTNQARQQQIQEQAYMRQLPLNELNALRTGAQVQNPQFQPYQGVSVAPPPIFAGAQAQAQANQGAYNAQVGQNNAFTNGLFSLGAAGIGAYPW